MNFMAALQRQFSYDAWANAEVLVAINAADSSSTIVRCQQVMAHIVAAEQLWLERLLQLPQSLPVWPDFTSIEIESHMLELGKQWNGYLHQTSSSALSNTITYQNSKGESWSNTVQDILTHVLFHSTYHRGQIAILMRTSGFAPAYTDFIHSVRQGLIE